MTVIDQQRTVPTVCIVCGAEFMQRPGRPPRCSVLCSQSHRRGRDHYLHRGGLAFDVSEGRWRIMCRDGTQVRFARAVMEAKIKRPLTRSELVHHRDEDTTNDDEDNLQIVTRAEHIEIHRELMRR